MTNSRHYAPSCFDFRQILHFLEFSWKKKRKPTIKQNKTWFKKTPKTTA
jgi:hypothetical protein